MGKLQGGTHRDPPDAPHFIESRCVAVHSCDRPTASPVLTRHADAADGGSPTIRVDRPPRLTTMSTAFSQDFVQADRLIRRRYVQIPGKQKELLERPDAWSENLSGGPRGMINVPSEVLQDVKDFHTRRHSRSTQQPNLTQPASSAGSVAPPQSTRSKQPLLSNPGPDQGDQAGDDGATQLSWSPSPPRPLPGGRPVQPTQRPESVSPSRTHPAPQPTFQKRKTPPSLLGGGPPSSAAQSDALPYEPLSALGEDSYPPVNRGANQVAATQSILPAATPPSAQVEVVPSTLMNTGQVGSVTAQSFHKRRRVEDIELPDKEPETTEKTRPHSTSNSIPRSAEPQNDRNTSSASISTPSFPSQAAVEQHQNSAPLQTASAANCTERSSSRYTPTYEGRPRDTPTQQENILRHSASGSSMAPVAAQVSAEPTDSGHVQESQPRVGNIIDHRTPYEEFKAAYSDYEESTRSFVRACLALKFQYERALPEFLYDDFVRVHSTVYIDYLQEAQIRKYSEVLRATQWYNENVKDMVYTKKFVRRDNLSAILKAHSKEVQKIRESIRDDAVSDQESDEDMADASEQVPGENSGSDESEPEEMPGSRLSPEFHIPSPGPAVSAERDAAGDGDLEETDDRDRPVPAPSRMRQNKGTVVEDHSHDSTRTDTAAPEASDRSRASPELNFQEPETVLDDEGSVKEVTHGVGKIIPGGKSQTSGQSRRNTPTPSNSTPKSANGQRKLLAPLPSSTPSSGVGSANRPAKYKAISPPTKDTARQSSPGFRSQAESSDDESDSFDPPVAKAAMPPSRSAKTDTPAFLTQAQPVYEIPGTPDALSEEPMPPPPPQPLARTPAAAQPRTTSGQTASAAAAAPASKPDQAVQKQLPTSEKVASRSSISSSLVARNSPALSDSSRVSVPLLKKREGETKEERSKRLKEHFRKRLSGKTPGSTPASTR